MCGLYGFETKKRATLTPAQKKQRENVTKALGVAMEKRGTDSSGVAGIAGRKCNIGKACMPSKRFYLDDEAVRVFSKDINVLIGHTRFATIGDVIRRNAHPFRKGDIVGAHNGGVWNYLQIDNTVQVDSEVIFTELQRTGNDYRNVFKKLSGQFAITWVDLNEDALYMVRSGNPLAVAYVPEIETMFWASEVEHLTPVLFSAFGADGFEPIIIESDQVYRFDADLRLKTYKVNFKEPAYYSTRSTGKGAKTTKKQWGLERDYWDSVESGEEYGADGYYDECCVCLIPLFPDMKIFADDGDELFCEDCAEEWQDHTTLYELTDELNNV